MKIRTGFVSNSSSSSFMLMGWDKKNNEDFYEESGCSYYAEEGLFGVPLPAPSEYDYDCLEWQKLNNALKKAYELKEKYGFEEEPKLFYGTRLS